LASKNSRRGRVRFTVALMKRLWALPTRRRTLTVLGLSVLALAGALAGGVQFFGASRSNAASHPCGRGIPAFKCDPSLGPPLTTGTNPALPQPAQFWPSPEQIQCGPAFFSPATQQQLSDSFGAIGCFRFSGRKEWIVLGDGTSLSGNVGAPGGQIVAVLRCSSANDACLDPDAQHDFGDFTVSHPPLAASFPGKLLATFGGRLLYISDANCGSFTFDVVSGRWYGRTTDAIDRLMRGGTPAAVAAPADTPGREAIGRVAPPTVAASCG
jgi:hypothetical protein